jgi:hypothetical protein
MDDELPTIPPDHRLRACPQRQAGMAWPIPIHARLDELVEIARDQAGRETNRKELVAALLLAAPTEAETLDEIIRRYRLATAREALVKPEHVERDNVLQLPSYGPGPR